MKIGRQKLGSAPVILKRSRTFMQKLGIIVRVAVLIALVGWLIWSQENWVYVNKTIFAAQKVPKTFVGYTIAHVSDLHNSNLAIVDKVKKQNPNIIIVTGGFTDDAGNYQNSMNTMRGLASVAPVYYVLGDNDDSQSSAIISTMNQFATLLEGSSVDIEAPQVTETAFIDKYIGNRIVEKAAEGNQDAVDYIQYTREKLKIDEGKTFKLSGLSFNEQKIGLIDKIYDIIGTDKSVLQIMLMNRATMFDEVSIADIDVVFSGETHGSKTVGSGYKKGVYAKSGTTMFLSSGIGNLAGDSKRIFNYPQIDIVVLSDGTITQENPIEKLLGYFIVDVKTKFDGDAGYKEGIIHYTDGREERGN